MRYCDVDEDDKDDKERIQYAELFRTKILKMTPDQWMAFEPECNTLVATHLRCQPQVAYRPTTTLVHTHCIPNIISNLL